MLGNGLCKGFAHSKFCFLFCGRQASGNVWLARLKTGVLYSPALVLILRWRPIPSTEPTFLDELRHES